MRHIITTGEPEQVNIFLKKDVWTLLQEETLHILSRRARFQELLPQLPQARQGPILTLSQRQQTWFHFETAF